MKKRKNFSKDDLKLLKRAIQYLKPHKVSFIILIILLLAELVFNLAQPLIFSQILDSTINSELDKVFFLVLITLGLMIIVGVMTAVSDKITVNLSNKIILKLRNDLFSNILYLPMSVFDTMKKGEFVTRFETDIRDLAQILAGQLSEFFVDIIKLFFIGIIVCFVNLKMALFLIGYMPISYFIFRIVGKRVRKQAFIVKKEADHYLSFLQEVLLGIKEIKKMLIEKNIQMKMYRVQERYTDAEMKKNSLRITGQFINTCFSAIGKAGLFLLGAYEIYGGYMTVGTFVAFNNYSVNFQSSFINVTRMNIKIQEALVSIKRIFELYDLIDNYKDDKEYIDTKLLEGHIKLENVVFRYEQRNILDGIDLDVKPCSVNTLVGCNGCGKTTLFNIIMRFYDPNAGQIYIDGYDISEIEIKILRSSIAYVSQEPFLFDETIKENLLYAKEDATDNEIIDSCKCSGIHQYIESLDKGYNTGIGELGKKFSTGQKQRLEIAKAILSNKKIILLDEPTSALDVQNKKVILNLLNELKQTHTILLISHDLELIEQSDNVIFINKGKVSNSGTHGELIEIDEKYKKLLQEFA